MSFLRRARAYFLRDARRHLSYRVAVLLDLASLATLVTLHYYLGKLVDSGSHPALDGEHGYFGFVLVGLALANFLTQNMRSIADGVRQGQLEGTLEIQLAAPVSAWEVVVSSGIWSTTYQLGRVVLILGAGVLLGIRPMAVDWLALVGVLGASVAAIIPLGVLGAAFVVTWQRGDPLAYLVGVASTLFAGVYYPLELLPHGLQWFAQAFPLTHGVDALREVLLRGATLGSVLPQLSKLVMLALVLAPLSAGALHLAVRRARRLGSLSRY